MILKNVQQFIGFIRKDRAYLVLLILQVLSGLWMISDVLLNVRTGQLQTWYRFTSFGAESYNRASWMYSYSWAVLMLAMTVLHVLLSAKLLKQNYRELALLVLGLGIVMLIIASTNFNMIMALPR